MTNKEFLERASKLQKDYVELNKTTGIIGVNSGNFQITSEAFRECEKEGLLEHISGEVTEERDYLRLQAMAQTGVTVIALEDLDERKGK